MLYLKLQKGDVLVRYLAACDSTSTYLISSAPSTLVLQYIRQAQIVKLMEPEEAEEEEEE